MTPTTSERDRFEAWAKDTMSLVKEPGGYKEATTHHAWRAWQAALTREQREGVVTFAVDDVRFDVPASIAEKVAAKLAPADNLPQPETPGAVACWRLVSRFGVCSVWLTGDISADAARQAIADGNRVERAYTTPPAPVDVRLRVLLERMAAHVRPTCSELYDEARALLDGQQAGVCSYPDCNCPFDAPADPNWCARGLPKAARPQVELAELPVAFDRLPCEPDDDMIDVFTPTQMHAYARQAIAESEARAEGLAGVLRSIAEDCRRGADEQGMSPAGVQDIARRCDAAIAQEAELESASA